MQLEIPMKQNNRIFLNADKNRRVLRHLPVLSKEEFIRWAPEVVEGAGPGSCTERSFMTLRSRNHCKDCMVFVSSPGDYTESLLRSGQPYLFEDCLIIIDEGADLDWMSLQVLGLVTFKDCIFRKLTNPAVSPHLSTVPGGCVCSGNRQILAYFHFGIPDRIKSISRMPYCAKKGCNESIGYNVILPSDLVSKRDYLAAYWYLREFLDYHGMGHLYSSPLDNFPKTLFSDTLLLPKPQIKKYGLFGQFAENCNQAE